MAIPSVNMLSNEAGGGFNAAMRANNSLANENILRQINQIKKTYTPATLSSEAASKLAYANLMGPQFLAKLLGNDSAIANMGDPAAKAALQKAVQAGMGQGTGLNTLNQMGQGNGIPTFTGIGQPSTNNFSGYLQNAIKNLIGRGQTPQANPLAQMGNQTLMQQPAPQQQPMPQAPAMPSRGQVKRPKDGVTLEGEQWYNAKGEPVYADEEPQAGQTPMELELNEGQRGNAGNPGNKSYAENTGEYKGTVEEGKELGKHRAQVINDIGEQQLQLSNTGANLDKLVGDINDPKFMELRNDFPFYQDMQLTALSKVGTPEQQEMIGNFIADVKSFAGATVNSFKGQSMKREFDYADQLKPSENDTVNTARGKLTALKSLKEIAERKNDIMLDLMQNKHMNLGDAVKKANKMVDVKAIDQEVKKLTSPMITLKDPKNPSITIRLPLWEARQRGVKNV
jgi:hypothetical protein